MEQQSPLSKTRTVLYNRIHRLTLWGIFGVSIVTTGLLAYNIYLFKRDGVPMLIEKYRSKAEEEIELKQKEAEYLKQRRQAETSFFDTGSSK